jgi:hypothetical protein
MPRDLQELCPKPDFYAVETTQNRIPKLAVRGRNNNGSPMVAEMTLTTLSTTNPFTQKQSKETLRSSDENTLSPSTPTVQGAPWEKEKKYEPRPATTHSNSYNTTSTDRRHSDDTTKQPFRHEVFTNSKHTTNDRLML